MAGEITRAIKSLAIIEEDLHRLDKREKPLCDRPNLLWEEEIETIRNALKSSPEKQPG